MDISVGDPVYEAPAEAGFGEDKIYIALPLLLERLFL